MRATERRRFWLIGPTSEIWPQELQPSYYCQSWGMQPQTNHLILCSSHTLAHLTSLCLLGGSKRCLKRKRAPITNRVQQDSLGKSSARVPYLTAEGSYAPKGALGCVTPSIVLRRRDGVLDPVSAFRTCQYLGQISLPLKGFPFRLQ